MMKAREWIERVLWGQVGGHWDLGPLFREGQEILAEKPTFTLEDVHLLEFVAEKYLDAGFSWGGESGTEPEYQLRDLAERLKRSL